MARFRISPRPLALFALLAAVGGIMAFGTPCSSSSNREAYEAPRTLVVSPSPSNAICTAVPDDSTVVCSAAACSASPNGYPVCGDSSCLAANQSPAPSPSFTLYSARISRPVAAMAAPVPVDIIAEVVGNKILVSAGDMTVTEIPIVAGDIAASGQISPAAGTAVRQAMNWYEGALMSNGETVGKWTTTGFKFSLAALFFLALEGSARAGAYAADKIGAWVDANNRGVNCPKLVDWITNKSKAPVTCDNNNCEDCYNLRINTIPSDLTAQTCYTDIIALASDAGAANAIQAKVNARAQSVVANCGAKPVVPAGWFGGGKRGGFGTVPHAGVPPFDGVNVPDLATVCPVTP